MHMLAIDLGKQSFHIYGISDDGEVVSRKVGRAKLVDAVSRLRPQLVAMEACASSHHWGRTFESLGHEEIPSNTCKIKEIPTRACMQRLL